MKSKTKLLLVVGIVVALFAGYMIGILVKFPPIENSKFAGTFGKAEKFHKVQMTEKDIQLRTELTKDTAQLGSMIKGLAYFSVFTQDVCTTIDMSLVTFKAKGVGTEAAQSHSIQALQEYADFIRNNNKNLNDLISMLTGFYTNKPTDQSQDVERSLRDFIAYVNNLSEKNAQLVEELKSIDQSVLANKTLLERQDEMTQVKSIRDQILTKGIQLASILGSKDQVGNMISFALTSQNQYSVIASKDDVKSTLNKDHLNLFNGQQTVNSIIIGSSGSAVSNISVSSVAALLLYDRQDMKFWAGNKEQLSVIAANHDLNSFNCIASSVNGNLNVICNNYSLHEVIQSGLIGSYQPGSSQVLQVLASSNIQSMFSSLNGFNSTLGFGLGRNLGPGE
jgi:hypothetical protein